MYTIGHAETVRSNNKWLFADAEDAEIEAVKQCVDGKVWAVYDNQKHDITALIFDAVIYIPF
jgi:hypothetical protein